MSGPILGKVLAVVMEAYVHGVSTRAVDDLVEAMGVDAGIAADGSREVLGLGVGDSEDEAFWRCFLTALKQRGLHGVRLVISDQHSGLVKALKRSFQGAGHQRCRVHFAPQSARPRSQVARRHGRRGVPHDLRPARRRGGQQHLGRGPRPAQVWISPATRGTVQTEIDTDPGRRCSSLPDSPATLLT